MDHHERHHQQHQKEREQEKKRQKEYEREQSKSLIPFHPAWLFGVGVVLLALALLVWTLFLSS
jgi:hypothetical protein